MNERSHVTLFLYTGDSARCQIDRLAREQRLRRIARES